MSRDVKRIIEFELLQSLRSKNSEDWYSTCGVMSDYAEENGFRELSLWLRFCYEERKRPCHPEGAAWFSWANHYFLEPGYRNASTVLSFDETPLAVINDLVFANLPSALVAIEFSDEFREWSESRHDA